MLQAVVFGGLFLVLCLPLYVENDFFFPFITGKNFAFRILVEIVFAAWILLALWDVQYRPKFSWILPAFGSLLVIMFAANALGEYPLQSFWSNFERMDGYVTLVHVFLYTLVLGSVMTTHKLWSYFLNTTVAVASVVALYGLAQYTGVIEGGRDRIDSTLGNAAYMAVYMLFHLFFVIFLLAKNKVNFVQLLLGIVGLVGYVFVTPLGKRYLVQRYISSFLKDRTALVTLLYLLMILVFTTTLVLTGTRGTFLGFVGGSGAIVLYIALFGRRVPELRKYAVGGLIALVIAGLAFLAVRDNDFVQNSGPLARIANIDLGADLVVRSTIWGMAWEGVKERPILGYGQGNFNYVFNEKYDASLYAQEQWFDRVHNIFFDWLIAGGLLGFIAYFSIMAAAVFYLLIEPVFLKRESKFTVVERAVLTGLLVGYLTHNLVVFDNIISYIFYGTVLALIHSRVAKPVASVDAYKMEPALITQLATPIVIVITGLAIYFINLPGMQASADMIDALQSPDPQERLAEFRSAIDRDSFARQEIVEQLVQQAMSISRNQSIPLEDREAMVKQAELELLVLLDEQPGDARLHNFLSMFYRSIGAITKAREQAVIAVSLSPEKPMLILAQAIIELQENEIESGLVFLKQAFKLEERNLQARVLYAATLMQSGSSEEAVALIEIDPKYVIEFARSDYALSASKTSENLVFITTLLEVRVADEPANAQHRASLASVYHELGDTDKAIEILVKAGEDIQAFAPTATCYVANLEAGNTPEAGCNQ